MNKLLTTAALLAASTVSAMACNVERVGTVYSAGSQYYGQHIVVAGSDVYTQTELAAAGVSIFDAGGVAEFTGCTPILSKTSDSKTRITAGKDGVLGTEDDFARDVGGNRESW